MAQISQTGGGNRDKGGNTTSTNLNRQGAEYLDILGRTNTSGKSTAASSSGWSSGSGKSAGTGINQRGTGTSSSLGTNVRPGSEANQIIYNNLVKNQKTDEPSGRGYSGGGGGGGGANALLGATSMGDDIIAKLKGFLDEQNKAANASAEAWYNQLMNQIKSSTTSNLDLSNRQYKMDEKRFKDMYGNRPMVGTGFSNMARITQNWRDRNNAIRMNEADNSATALANYKNALANNASTLAQGWYNQILPYYVNQANRNA